MAEYTAQGFETFTRQAEPISEEAENIIWVKGLLDNSTGESMLNTVFLELQALWFQSKKHYP